MTLWHGAPQCLNPALGPATAKFLAPMAVQVRGTSRILTTNNWNSELCYWGRAIQPAVVGRQWRAVWRGSKHLRRLRLRHPRRGGEFVIRSPYSSRGLTVIHMYTVVQEVYPF